MVTARTSAGRFAWALALSALFHLAVTLGPGIEIPAYHPAPVLEATLRTLPAPTPPPARKPHLRPRFPAHAQANQASPASPSAVPAPPQPSLDTAPAAEPAPAAPPDISPPEAAAAPPAPLPELAEMRFLLYKGLDGFVIGKAEHTWKRDGMHYTITQVAEADGIVSLFFRGRHVQISAGEITPQGLRPASYWVQRSQSADKTDSALFDWESMSLTFGTGGDTRRVPLPPGTQDLLSFAYQLAFSPPQAGVTELFITNGRKLDQYGYRTLGDESIETPMGTLNALHIEKLHQAGEENTEIWLATEYHYLPVKIRQTDKQGGVIEQAASAINLR